MTPHLQRTAWTLILLWCEKSSSSVSFKWISYSSAEGWKNLVSARDEWIATPEVWDLGPIEEHFEKKKNQEFYLNYIACSKFYTLSNSHGSLSKRSWGILCSRNKTNWIKERRINVCFLRGWNLIWGPQKKERIILTTLAKRTLQFLLINVLFLVKVTIFF